MSEYKHKQISLSGNSIYCEPHDEWLDILTAITHACFQESPTFVTPELNIDYKFTVRRDGILDFMDADRLLAEWYNWWAKSEHTPAKMPDSIHTRTAVYLATKDMVLKDDRRSN